MGVLQQAEDTKYWFKNFDLIYNTCCASHSLYILYNQVFHLKHKKFISKNHVKLTIDLDNANNISDKIYQHLI